MYDNKTDNKITMLNIFYFIQDFIFTCIFAKP